MQTRWPNITSILNNLPLKDTVALTNIRFLKVNGIGSTQMGR